MKVKFFLQTNFGRASDRKTKVTILLFVVFVGFACSHALAVDPSKLISISNTKPPKPILVLDFEESGPKTGIAQSGCLDLSRLSSSTEIPLPLVYQAPDLLEALRSVKSLTVTGWIKTRVYFESEENSSQYVLNCPGLFYLMSKGNYMGVVMTANNAKPIALWSPYPYSFCPHDRWVFFAFSYDGTQEQNNGSIYQGFEQYSIKKLLTKTVKSGMLSENALKHIIVGAAEPGSKNGVNGMIDSLRIYASRDDGSGALTERQIESVRQSDLGEQYLAKLAKQRAKELLKNETRNQKLMKKYWSGQFNAVMVDVLDRIYPDQVPLPSEYKEPISVPRGGRVSFQFAVMAKENSSCKFKTTSIRQSDGTVLPCKAKTYELKSIPVEANNNGGMNTAVGVKPPGLWMEYCIREAPFEMADAMIESDGFQLEKDKYYGVLVDVDVAQSAKAGVYEASILFHANDHKVETHFYIEVHKTVMPRDFILHSGHGLSSAPEDLTNKNIPQWWSQRHWYLLKKAGLVLRSFGQNMICIPLVDGRQPLIQTVIHKDGSYSFDYDRFDRFVGLFRDIGFTNFRGSHIGGGHGGTPMNVYAIDESTGKKVEIFSRKSDWNLWLDFIPIFYKSLSGHLQQKGWMEFYLQSQIDEPTNLKRYKEVCALAKKYMPNVRTIDACGDAEYSPYMDVQIFNISLAWTAKQEIATQQRRQGREVWLYHCCSPYPPFPNRHLDEALSSSRLYPWLCHLLQADGYFFWAANRYRGANPYKSSIGPMPNGSQNPGHPAGDNWMFYPGPDGLLSSMRMIAFRDGMIDHTLLKMLEAKNRKKADEIMNLIARTALDYESKPAVYHKTRKTLLEILDKN